MKKANFTEKTHFTGKGKSRLYHTVKLKDSIESIAEFNRMMYNNLIKGSGIGITIKVDVSAIKPKGDQVNGAKNKSKQDS